MANEQLETTATVATLLGGKKVLKRDIAERDELREIVRQGFPFRALETFAHTTRIPIALIAKVLGLAPRTLARRKDQRLFTSVESDRLYRLARIASMAMHVLGSQDKATHWLERPNRALGGESPLSLLDTDIGARQVEAELGRIDYGVFS